MMKKRYVWIMTACMAISLAVGCGNKTAQLPDAEQQEAQVADDKEQDSQTETTESINNQQAEVETTEVPGTEAGNQTDGEQKTLVGTVEEIKDFMFIVTDETGAAYEMSFDTKPEGLDSIAAGDKVKVTYTGELSEVDPFTGTIISVEKDAE